MSIPALMASYNIPPSGGGGLSVLQSTLGHQSGGTSCPSPAMTTQASGSSFLVAVIHEPGKTIAITDTYSNTWTQIGTPQSDPSGTEILWFYKYNGAGGSGHVFTATSTGGVDYTVIIPVEIAGLAASPLDAAAQNSFSGSQPYGSTVPTGVLAQANEIVFFLMGENFSGVISEATGTILQQENDFNLYYPGALSYKIVSATTSIAASWTISGGSSSCALKACSFKG